MRRRRGGFRRVEEVAAAAGTLLPRSPRGLHLRALAAWRSAVGQGLSRSTRVSRLEAGVLTVEVPDVSYGASLEGMRDTILDRFRQRMGKDAPRSIRFQVSPGFWRPPEAPARRSAWAAAPPASPPAPRQPDAAGAPSEAAPAAAPRALDEAAVLAVRDPGRRRAFLRVANRYLERGSASPRRS